ncbi:spermidine hydroxycinnamoyltransferase 2 [Rosa sericea]
MALSNGVTMLLPEAHIESVQSVMPFKITDPRPARQVLAADPVGLGIFQQCLHILLYYTKAIQEDSGWLHAGWIKESLSRALLEQPLFAGRLRTSDGGELEIVANDSGIRLVETRTPMTMAEFLSYKDSTEDTEDKLVFWKTIDEQSPQYSPLFYVQVTYFQCGGRSVGISCSVLLADLLFKENFLKKWANIHHNLLSDKCLPATPFYNFPHVENSGKSCKNIFVSIPSKKCGKTMIFNVAAEKADSENDDALQLCVEEAESKFGFGKLFVKINISSCSAIKVENFQKEGLAKPKLSRIAEADWDDFGAKEVEFREGNKPATVSYWFGFISGGLVMAVPSSADQEGASVIVTVPN